ncbi:MAG: hypothetical protein ACON4H_04580 [Rubripirellula sp.]
MSHPIIHSCSSCGRPVQIAASMIGTAVACPHCQAKLGDVDSRLVNGSASGVSYNAESAAVEIPDLMSRVDAALAKVSDHRNLLEPLS